MSNSIKYLENILKINLMIYIPYFECGILTLVTEFLSERRTLGIKSET